MADYNKCPKCYNYIDEFNIDKTKIHRVRGELGLDENGDPFPFWSDDPVFTFLGLAGTNYKGTTVLRLLHITELQDYYRELEETLLDTENRTDFLTIEEIKLFKHVHIEQLRISIENLLSELNLTLADYFKYDRHGNEITTTQSEWTDVNRVNKTDLPGIGEEGYVDYGYIAGDTVPLLIKPINIKAIHIEELRIGMSTFSEWIETWNPSEVKSYVDFSHTLTEDGASPGWYSPALIGSTGKWQGAYYDGNQSFYLTVVHPHLITPTATGVFKQDIINQGVGDNYMSIFLSSTISASIIFNQNAQANAKHSGSFSLNYPYSGENFINVPLNTNTVFKFDSLGTSVTATSGDLTKALLLILLNFGHAGFIQQVILEQGIKLTNTRVQVTNPTNIDEVFGVYDNPEGTGINYYTGGFVSDPINGVITLGTPLLSTAPYVTYNYRYGQKVGKDINYALTAGSPSGIPYPYDFSGILLSSFANFERNLWNDFNSLHGDPSGYRVNEIKFKGAVSSNARYNNSANSASVSLKMDNITIR